MNYLIHKYLRFLVKLSETNIIYVILIMLWAGLNEVLCTFSISVTYLHTLD